MKRARGKGNPRICTRLLAGLLAAALAPALLGAEAPEPQLPPPAALQVEFARDIQPLLQSSCLRCHGPERPKSGFRLDSRTGALRGGEHGVDIVPGNSTGSPLIRYVAQLVPDLEMPPEGKGEPLTPDQVGLLRAWIDQGLVWDKAAPTNQLDVTASPFAGVMAASGDKQKFSEHYWRREGTDGGLQQFEIIDLADPDTRVMASGHGWLDDYKLVLEADRNEVGFVRGGWEQYRKYYDGHGGSDPAAGLPRPQTLGNDLHLDIGKAWIDLGLTLPRWPRMVLGYEYDYKRGQEATTSWGSDGVPGNARNLAPTSKRIDEGTHILKFDFDAEVQGVTIEDRFRGEVYQLNTAYTNLAARGSMSQNASDDYHYFQGANSLRLEKQFKKWLFGSAGYFFSHLDADDSFTDATGSGQTVYLASAPHIVLSRDSQLVNLNALLGPFDGLTLSAGVQSEWTRQQAVGSGNLNGISYALPPSSNLAIRPASLSSDYDQETLSEQVGLRYTKIPFTSVFADARLQQETMEQSDRDIQSGGSFLEDPSFSSRLTDVRAGFATSPWERVSFSAHYRRYEVDSQYQTNQPPQPAGGYPGFIASRDLVTDETEAKLVLRPANWLKTTLSYEFVTTDYQQDTRPAFGPVSTPLYSPGGPLLAGRYVSDIYSLGATFTPLRRLSLSATFSYQWTRATTASGGLVPPYEGGVYSVLASGTYIFNNQTDLTLSYSFSLGDYSQPNSPANPESPPPLGISYQQHALQAVLSCRISKRFTTRLQYGYYFYDEPTAGGALDYRVHSVLAMLTYHFR